MARNRGVLIKKHVYLRETEDGPRYTIVMRGIDGGQLSCPIGTTEGQVDRLVQKFQSKRTREDGRIMPTIRSYSVAEGWQNFAIVFERQVALGEASAATMSDVYEPGWRLHIEKPLGRKKLNDVSPADIKRLSQSVRADRSNSTARRVETILRSIFREARLAGWTENDPFKDLRSRSGGLAPSDPKRPRKKALTAEQMRRLLEHTTDYLWSLVVALCEFPVRSSELLGLTWKDIDFDGVADADTIGLPVQPEADDVPVEPGQPCIYFRVQAKRDGFGEKKTKNKKAVRPLPISPMMRAVLLGLREKEEAKGLGGGDDRVFTHDRGLHEAGTPVNRAAAYRAVHQAAERAGLPRTTPKDLRMSLATAMSLAGTPRGVAASSAGHDADTYDRYYDHSDREWQARIEAFRRLREAGYGVSEEEMRRRGFLADSPPWERQER